MKTEKYLGYLLTLSSVIVTVLIPYQLYYNPNPIIDIIQFFMYMCWITIGWGIAVLFFIIVWEWSVSYINNNKERVKGTKLDQDVDDLFNENLETAEAKLQEQQSPFSRIKFVTFILADLTLVCMFYGEARYHETFVVLLNIVVYIGLYISIEQECIRTITKHCN